MTRLSNNRQLQTVSEGTAQRLEDAAVALFFRFGYPATTIREITSALGLTPGSFYNHFRAKEELLYSVISRTHVAIEHALGAGLDRGGERASRQLWEVVHALSGFYTAHPMEALISKQEWHRLAPPQQAEVLQSERRIRNAVERILEAGVAAGEFRLSLIDGNPVDIPITAKAVLDQIIGPTSWFRPRGRVSARELAEHHAVLILQMVGTSAAVIQSAAGASETTGRRRARA